MENIQILVFFEPKLIFQQILLVESLILFFLIHIPIRNLNFTMEKLRKQHIFSFEGR